MYDQNFFPISAEQQLIEAIRAGDRQALRRVFLQHYPQLCRTADRYLSAEAMQAEDLVQEVFARFWQRRDRLQVHTSLGAYLHRMTVNEAISYLRKQKKWQTEELDPARESGSVVAPSGEEQLAASDLQQQIDRALQRLPLRCRTVFLLSRKDRLSYKEIAEQLEISVKTVENQMGKALRIMREELNEYL